MAIENLRDENLLRFYDNIREQVEADKRSKYKFAASHSVKEYAGLFLWALFGLLAVETLLAVRFGRRRI